MRLFAVVDIVLESSDQARSYSSSTEERSHPAPPSRLIVRIEVSECLNVSLFLLMQASVVVCERVLLGAPLSVLLEVASCVVIIP